MEARSLAVVVVSVGSRMLMTMAKEKLVRKETHMQYRGQGYGCRRLAREPVIARCPTLFLVLTRAFQA